MLHNPMLPVCFQPLSSQAQPLSPSLAIEFLERYFSPLLVVNNRSHRHSDEDKNHYEEFSWKNEHGKVEKVIPTSDISFTAFRAIMKKEWESMMRPNAAA